MAFNIIYTLRKAIKSQAIANFIADWTEAHSLRRTVNPEHWTLYFDGLIMLLGVGAGIVLISPKGEKLKYVLQIHFTVSNNVADYEALLHGPRIVISLVIHQLLSRVTPNWWFDRS